MTTILPSVIVVPDCDLNRSQHAFRLEPLNDDLPIRPIRRSTLTTEDDLPSIDWSELEDKDWNPPTNTKAAKRLTEVFSDGESNQLLCEDKITDQASRSDLRLVKDQIQEIHTMLSTLLSENNCEDYDSSRGTLRTRSPPQCISLARTRSIRHARISRVSGEDDMITSFRSGISTESTIDSEINVSFRSNKSKSKSNKMSDKHNEGIRSRNAHDSTSKPSRDRSGHYESTHERIHTNSQILDKYSINTNSTKPDSDWDDSSIDERLERDYGIPRRLRRQNSFQPGMQHFVHHPSSRKHSRSFNGRIVPLAFDGHRSYPVIRVSKSQHSRFPADRFEGHSSDPSFDFSNMDLRPPFWDGPPSKSFHNCKLTSTDMPQKPIRRHSKQSKTVQS